MSPRRGNRKPWRDLFAALVAVSVVLATTSGAAARGVTHPGLGAVASGQVFDASVRSTSGRFLPLNAYTPATVAPFTTEQWTSAARPLTRVAADGVSLLLVRLALPANFIGSVTLELTSDVGGADPGSLWAVNDQGVVDVSAAGGAIDESQGPPRTTLTVPVVLVGQTHYALALYRSPRNFDGTDTGRLASRTVRLVTGVAQPITLTIVRPLVVFVHGTFADNDTWIHFPLWRDSANEMSDFQPTLPGGPPFSADRISFDWIWNSTGHVVENAETILAQLVRAIRDWGLATGTAATQADVITHSFGGFVARQAAQTQPDPSPLTPDGLGNFRSASNWGHGAIHKLVTLAATHRGAATSNATAFVNQQGVSPGSPRALACLAGAYIDRGAVRDQMVLSDALRALGRTRLPGHAIVGSGRALLDPTGSFAAAAKNIATLLDKSTGPYATAFADPNCPQDALANYTFNLNKATPPVTGSGTTCSVTPDYDLVLSAYSSQGLLPDSATTTAADLEIASGLGLIGRLNHSALHDPTFGSPEIVRAVSDRIVFLLQQPTTSTWFSHFPAVTSVAPDPVEEQLDQFDPTWLETGDQCGSPVYQPGCTAGYTSIKVVPSRLQLEDATPAPLYVYGLQNGQWLLAYSPTFLFAAIPPLSRNCPVTLTSSNPAVVAILTNSETGASVPVAVGVGSATIQVTVQGFAGSIPPVPVTVTSVGD
jgi:pimeloyl-ACP methyl ester carboxylesterase